MLPRWHVFLGAVFTALLWIVSPSISLLYLALVFLASVFIDIDHYLCAVSKTGQWSLFHAFAYHKRRSKEYENEKAQGIKKRGDFHIFHTIEFHLLIAMLALFWTPLLYIFIGMVFHSLLDFIDIAYKDYLYLREYFLFSWIRKKFIVPNIKEEL